MSRWKSRWSRVRFVKTARSKRQPSTRSSASACEETSIAAAGIALAHELREQLLEERRVRRRAVGRRSPGGRCGSRSCRGIPRSPKRRARSDCSSSRRRRLAVGARDAREHELLGRIAREARREQRRARRRASGDADPGHRQRSRRGPLGDDRGGAARDRLGHVRQAVDLLSADGDEEVPGRDAARVVHDAADVRIRAGRRRSRLPARPSNSLQPHGPGVAESVSSRPRPGRETAAASSESEQGHDGTRSPGVAGRRPLRPTTKPLPSSRTGMPRRANRASACRAERPDRVGKAVVRKTPAATARRRGHPAGRGRDDARGEKRARGGSEHRGRHALLLGRNSEDREGLRDDSRKDGSGDVARVVLAVRLFQDDDADQPRGLRRHESDEVGNVPARLVAARPGLLRGAGLARDREARDRRERARAVLDDADEDLPQRRRPSPGRSRARERPAAERLDACRRAGSPAERRAA